MIQTDWRLAEAEIGKSVFMRRVEETGRMAFLDIDGTTTGDTWVRSEVREFFEERAAVAFVSARTPELIMSHAVWSRSYEQGTFFRPAPKPQVVGGAWEFCPIEQLIEFKHLLDTPAILSFGVGNFFRTSDGSYVRDEAYHRLLGGDDWRHSVALPFLQSEVDHEGELLSHLTILCKDNSHDLGRADVAPPDFRLDFNFDSLEAKLALTKRIRAMARGGVVHNGVAVPRSAIAAGIKVVDESHPELSRFTAYLVSKPAVKEKLLRRVIEQACFFSNRPRRELEVFIAGDTLTDFRAGLLAGWAMEAHAIRGTFFLAGGSRLAPYLVGEQKGMPFAGESLEWARKRLQEAMPGNQPGVYYFRAPWGGNEFRRVIIADEAFPGTIAAESLAAYIHSDLCSW